MEKDERKPVVNDENSYSFYSFLSEWQGIEGAEPDKFRADFLPTRYFTRFYKNSSL